MIVTTKGEGSTGSVAILMTEADSDLRRVVAENYFGDGQGPHHRLFRGSLEDYCHFLKTLRLVEIGADGGAA